QSFDPFNVLVNYWWANETASAGLAAVAHGLLALRDLPYNEKQAWRALFDHYVFGEDAARAVDHLPEHIQGVLGPSSQERDRKIAAFLIGGLSDI
ncbi:MAG: cupin-like domain-containing protein, partial [Pseudomonadota bacterium]